MSRSRSGSATPSAAWPRSPRTIWTRYGRPLDEEEVDFTTGAVVLDIRFDEPVSTRRDSGA